MTASSAVVRLRTARTLLVVWAGTAILLVPGVAALVGAAAGRFAGRDLAKALVLGVVLTGFGLLMLLGALAASRDRRIVVDADGIHWVEARRPWSVRWSELTRASVRFSQRRPRRRGEQTSRTLWRPRPAVTRVHLELVLADPDPAHSPLPPRLRRLQTPVMGGGPGVIGVPLGPRRDLIDPLVRAFETYGGERAGGAIDDGVSSRTGDVPGRD